MNFFLIVLIFIAAIGGLVFGDQVRAAFQGMTALGAIDFIMMFVLKAAVLAILSWCMYHLPEMVRPWLRLRRRALRQKHRNAALVSPTLRAPRLNKDALLLWMAGQLQRRFHSKSTTEAPAPDEARLRFE